MPIDFNLPKRVPSPKRNPEVDFWLYDRHLEKSTWRHNFTADSLITTKFDRLMQNHLPMTINRSNSKPETQFQYDGSPFSETGSSLILSVDWDISYKFSKEIYIHLLKRVPLRNLNPEVAFPFYGCHLEQLIWRHNSATKSLIATKFGRWMQNDIAITTLKLKSKPEVQYNTAAITFPKPEVILSESCIKNLIEIWYKNSYPPS